LATLAEREQALLQEIPKRAIGLLPRSLPNTPENPPHDRPAFPAGSQQHRLGRLRHLPWRVDPAQYKDYILVMLFLKYISDLWADHYAEYQKEYGNNEERIRRKLERERFVLPYVEFKDEKTGQVTDRFLADFHALYERRKAANLGELINIVLDHIEEANKTKLEGVFRNIDFNSEANLGKTKDRNRRLENLLGDFASSTCARRASPRM
jgi:type I restriction-modification system DNA methylase subunit